MKPIQIKHEELKKIPFIDASAIRGRTINTLSFFENNEWHFWIPTQDGLHFLYSTPIEGTYLGRSPENSNDAYFEFFNFISQKACWSDTLETSKGIESDIHNLGASLAKIKLFHLQQINNKKEIRRFVSTEIEYILEVCRSTFDLLQETISKIWNRIKISDTNIKKRNLPMSFAKMVMKNDTTRYSAEEISEKWCIPIQLANYYHDQGEFFEIIRNYRNYISHHGYNIDLLFSTQKGFAVQAEAKPFSLFKVWNKEHMQHNNLASLRPALAHIIYKTILALEDFSTTIQKIIQFPPDIAPGFKLFMRGYHIHELLNIEDIIKDCLWWDEDPPPAQKASAPSPSAPPLFPKAP